MSALQNPSALNPLRQYLQANHLLKKTSRAKNPAWYQEALELDYQLHFRTDGASVSAFLYDRKEDLWAHGPALTEKSLLDPEAMVAYTTEAIRHVKAAGGTSIGVVLHIADEFALTEINPDLTDRDTLSALRETALHDPLSILADSSADASQSNWRIIPYFAAASQSMATAVTISRRHEPMLDALRALGNREDFPLVTHALSAPLVALLGLFDTVKPRPDRPSVAILQYPFFTVLAFFNDRSDLILVRTQLHRGLRRPPNFRHAIATSNASLELDNPDIFVFRLGADIDPALAADLATTFISSRVEVIPAPITGSLPDWCAECVIATRAPEPGESASGSLQALREDKWALQDFLPAQAESASLYPTKAEIRLMKGLGAARKIILTIGLIAAAWLATGIIKIRLSPDWAFKPEESDIIKTRLIALNAEKAKAQQWDALMEDRSKAWSSMEFLSRLFPENSGILTKTFNYTARPDTSPGQAKVGVVREWKITGFVKDEALELLSSLNSRERMAAHFNEVARVTGNSAFRTDIGTRNIVVNIRTQENPGYKPAGRIGDDLIQGGNTGDYGFPFTFDLVITQRFEAADPLAVVVAKAP